MDGADSAMHSVTTTKNNTPSPRVQPALPPVRDLAPLSLCSERASSDFSPVVPVALPGINVLSSACKKEELQQMMLLQQIQQIQQLHQIQQQHSALLQLQQALTAAAIANPAAPETDTAQQLLLLQQLQVLLPAQQLALLPALAHSAGASPANTACFPQETSYGMGARISTFCSSDAGNGSDKDGAGRRKFHGKAAVACLQEWLYANMKNPYPSLELKRGLAHTSGLSEAQVDHWFNNARKRLIKARKPKKENLNPCPAVIKVEEQVKSSFGIRTVPARRSS